MNRKPKILIVDDKVENLIALERVFSGYEATLVRALSGKEALEKTLEHDFALVLLDVQMPDMDGFETLRLMRHNKRTEHLPVILISAIYSDNYYLIKGIETGAVDFIIKPFEPSILRGKVSIHLEMYRQRMSLQESHDNLEQLVDERTKELEKKIRELDERREELRKGEQKYRRLVENLREEYYFYSHGTDGVFTYVSPSITDVLGYSQSEFFKHYTEFLTPNPINKKVEKHTELSMKGEVQPPYELEIYHKDGNIRLLEISEMPVFDDPGNVIAVEGIAHDITERKKGEDILRETLHEKELLLREVHHRVKNNLLTLYSIVELQQSELSGNEEINLALGVTKQRIRTMGKVHEMLYQTKSLSELDFSEYIESMVTEIQRLFKSAEKKIDVSLDLEPVTLTINEGIPCGLILNELLMNAYQHAFVNRKSGQIFISLKKKNDVHELLISDDGVGMLEERLSGESKTLGLQLVTLLTQQLKGNITYKRSNGSEFRIVF